MKRLIALLMTVFCTFMMLTACGGGNGSSTDSGSTPPATPNYKKLVDFVVEVESGRDIVVLQLSDPQMIDSSQMRSPDRLDPGLAAYWGPDQKENRCFKYIRETVEATKPDLIIVTGDITYGEFDDDGSGLTSFIEFMEGFNIPWAPVLGNHEGESAMGTTWQSNQFMDAKNCLFRQRTLSGNGNYTVGIVQDNQLKRVFFMMDSNGCSFASSASLSSGHTVVGKGFEGDQIEWYTERITEIKQECPEVKLSFAFHIQIHAFVSAFATYGYTSASKDAIDLDEVGKEGDFGIINYYPGSPWDTNMKVFRSFKNLGVDSVFIGHEHANSASIVFEGIRLQFGQKSSTYDSTNYVTPTGKIVRSYSDAGMPLVGGTVIPVSQEDGSLKTPYIYLCAEE